MDILTPVTSLKAIESPEDLPSVVLTYKDKKMIVAITENALTVLQTDIPSTASVAVQSVSNDGYLLLQIQQTDGVSNVYCF